MVDEAAADVETLRVAYGRHFASARAWVTAAGPGAIPAEVANAFPERSSLTRDEYSIQWSVLEMLEEREVDSGSTPTAADADAASDSVELARASLAIGIGGMTLRSGQDDLLAELLAPCGPQASFVHDSKWTLIVGVTPEG